jgi:uncharacterized protein YbjT (DUF2867 family)
MRILILGATGRIGHAATSFLSSLPQVTEVRAATRDPAGAAARALTAMAPDVVRALAVDDNDEASLAAAATDADGIFVIAGLGPDPVAWHQRLARAAVAGGVKHLFKVSVTGARAPSSDPPPGRLPSLHFAGEEALRASGIPTTCVRPTIFAQHLLGLSPAAFSPGASTLCLPIGDTPVAFLDCRDIGEVGGRILAGDADLRGRFAGESFELTGPRGITGAEMAQVMSDVAGRAIAYAGDEDAFVARAKALGVPDGIKAIYHEAKGGYFSAVDVDAFTAICGRRTTSFARFAWDHAAAFARLDGKTT